MNHRSRAQGLVICNINIIIIYSLAATSGTHLNWTCTTDTFTSFLAKSPPINLQKRIPRACMDSLLGPSFTSIQLSCSEFYQKQTVIDQQRLGAAHKQCIFCEISCTLALAHFSLNTNMGNLRMQQAALAEKMTYKNDLVSSTQSPTWYMFFKPQTRCLQQAHENSMLLDQHQPTKA